MQYRQARKRYFFAILLMMVMMLQMGVKGLHLHEHAEKETIYCSDCDKHKVHSGHLLSWDGCSDDCLLCQLITTPFIEVDAITFTPVSVEYGQECHIYTAFCIDKAWRSIKPRGPPCC